MFRNLSVFVSFAAILFLSGCDQSFDSRASFQQQLVVFSVLSTDRNVQFVRVEGDYMPTEYDPLSSTTDHAISTATVTLSDGTASFQLRDTVITRTDTSRYGFPIHSFSITPFVPVAGRTYRLTINAPGFSTATASVTTPGKSFPGTSTTTYLILDNPGGYDESADIICNALLSTGTKGYIGRLFVDYDVLIGTEWIEGRAEIPLSFVDPKVRDLKYVLYPQMTTRNADRMVVSFKNSVYKAVCASVASGHFKSNKLVFNRVVFQLLQADKNLFNYYSTTHAFRDVASTRLDEPLFSNVSGGTGVLGAYTLDSLVHLLPEGFLYNNK